MAPLDRPLRRLPFPSLWLSSPPPLRGRTDRSPPLFAVLIYPKKETDATLTELKKNPRAETRWHLLRASCRARAVGGLEFPDAKGKRAESSFARAADLLLGVGFLDSEAGARRAGRGNAKRDPTRVYALTSIARRLFGRGTSNCVDVGSRQHDRRSHLQPKHRPHGKAPRNASLPASLPSLCP